MSLSVSIIIPNRNGEATIASCLEAALATGYKNFEVIVVDDFSTDYSVEIINRYPCKLLRLEHHCGASKARNVGAEHSSGDILFFTDADCLLNKDTLTTALDILSSVGPKVVLGGTYTPNPADGSFYSFFQSVFIHYSESQKTPSTDYVATHAMIINAKVFKQSGGFAEDFLPILEDVEYSHRMRRSGHRLVLNPAILVRHIFGYTLAKSMRNAFRKSMYWSAYSIANKDLLKDSGTASSGLKVNTLNWMIDALVLTLYAVTGEMLLLFSLIIIFMINVAWNRGLLSAFYTAGGAGFFAAAMLYYLVIYPLPVAAGGITGLLRYPWLKKIMGYSN